MKKNAFILVAVIFAFCISSCNKDRAELMDNYKKSLKAWQKFKNDSDNSYSYMVISSSWTGTSTQTIINVRRGKVIGRSFEMKGFASATGGAITVVEEWEEDESSLNTHTNGAPSRTLDEVYQLAKSDWLKKRDNSTNYFEAENDGMISFCGYSLDGCQDDCTTGIIIQWIRKL